MGKSMFEVAAVEKLVYHLRNNRAQKSVAFPIAFLVLTEKHIKVPKPAARPSACVNGIPSWPCPDSTRDPLACNTYLFLLYIAKLKSSATLMKTTLL